MSRVHERHDGAGDAPDTRCPTPLPGCGRPIDGPVDFARFTTAVPATGCDGPIEVEIFNADIWSRDGDAVLADLIERHRMHVA